MALLSSSTSLSDALKREPALIPVVNRFGISLGTGDSSIDSVCKAKGLDTNFFLTILNTFANEEYFPERQLKTINPAIIVDYLRLTDESYLKFQIPNIERHFNSLLQRSGSRNNLKLMKSFFDEVKKDLIEHIDFDLHRWFVGITSLTLPTITIPDGKSIEDKLSDLRNMMIMHLTGEYDSNLCYAVIVAIIAFEKDFKQNNRIRNRILYPLYIESQTR